MFQQGYRVYDKIHVIKMGYKDSNIIPLSQTAT